MGLDMFLYGIEYVDEINVSQNKIKHKIVKTEEIYWRKANHIHKWFVDNVQDGKDDCHYYELTYDDLIKLKNVCNSVLQRKDKAEELLPTQCGFFFGPTDYGEYYYLNCKETVKEIDRILNESNYDYFEYRSSW